MPWIFADSASVEQETAEIISEFGMAACEGGIRQTVGRLAREGTILEIFQLALYSNLDLGN